MVAPDRSYLEFASRSARIGTTATNSAKTTSSPSPISLSIFTMNARDFLGEPVRLAGRAANETKVQFQHVAVDHFSGACERLKK